MDLLRVYLLAGLIAHKAVWEALKRRQGAPAAATSPQPLSLLLVKAVKVAILLGIVAQTMLPEILPIRSEPGALRWAGVLLYTAGLATAILGRVQLGDNWLDIETAGVLRDQMVVSSGLYRYIRHPIYAGDLLLLAGLEVALNSWLALCVAALAAAVFRKAAGEERMLAAKLPGYAEYCRRTKRFVPFVV